VCFLQSWTDNACRPSGIISLPAMTRRQESAWKRYLSLFSLDTPLESLSYGDLRLLFLSDEWKERINQSKKLKHFSSPIPQLDENTLMTLTQCFDQMTKLMTVHAIAHKEKAIAVSTKLRNVIEISLRVSQYQFLDLHLLGSTMNCLAFDTSSDLDFALMVRSPQPINLKHLFDQMSPLLSSNGFLITDYVLHARVPILCLKDTDSDLEVCMSPPSLPRSPIFFDLFPSDRLISVSTTLQVLKIQN
jgi:hypothetical protein